MRYIKGKVTSANAQRERYRAQRNKTRSGFRNICEANISLTEGQYHCHAVAISPTHSVDFTVTIKQGLIVTTGVYYVITTVLH